MDQEILVNLGRVVYVNYGPEVGKLGVIVDIVNGKKVVISGVGLPKQMISNKRITLTKFRLPEVSVGVSQRTLLEKITAFKLQERFSSCGLGKRIQKQTVRAGLNDFQRFKVQVLKKKLGKALRTSINKNRQAILAKAK